MIKSRAEGYHFDKAFTSVLKRAIRTLWIVMDEMDLMWIPVYRSWRLNERHYGALQGLYKRNTEPLVRLKRLRAFALKNNYKGEIKMKQDATYIRWFEEIKIEDVPVVGGKNASLGEMYRELTPQGVKLPNGFAVTAEAYWYLVKSGNILPKMKRILDGIDKNDLEDFAKRGHAVRELIYTTPLPEDLAEGIVAAYHSPGAGRLCSYH